MNILESIILGVIQGATEFLPVSSSGHLIIIPKLFKISDGGWQFDAFIHLSTGLAVLTYFWSDWRDMFRNFKKMFKQARVKGKYNILLKNKNSALLIYIMLGSIPVGLIGFLFGDTITLYLRNPTVVIFTLIFYGILMIIVEKKKNRGLRETIYFKDALYIGLVQVLSLIPGTSRSGVTILAAIFRGIKRDEAAKFSFLLATPAVFLAGMYSFFKSLPYLNILDLGNYVIGFISAFFVGIFVIEFLLGYLKKSTLIPFGLYRIGLAVLVFAFLFF